MGESSRCQSKFPVNDTLLKLVGLMCVTGGLLQMPESTLVKLDEICRQHKVILLIARSYGLVGNVRISVEVCFELCLAVL